MNTLKENKLGEIYLRHFFKTGIEITNGTFNLFLSVSTRQPLASFIQVCDLHNELPC